MPRPYRRRFLVDGVDLGDGQPQRCWLIVGEDVVVVQRYRGRRYPSVFGLTTKEAMRAIAVAAQRRMVGEGS